MCGLPCIISAHDEDEQPEQAIQLYARMRQSGIVNPNDYVFVAALKACANARDLASGRLVHADVVDSGFQENVYVGSTLVDMYAKCNSLVDARTVFYSLPTKNVVTWSAMIAGYSQHELGQEALKCPLRRISRKVLDLQKPSFLSDIAG